MKALPKYIPAICPSCGLTGASLVMRSDLVIEGIKTGHVEAYVCNICSAIVGVPHRDGPVADE